MSAIRILCRVGAIGILLMGMAGNPIIASAFFPTSSADSEEMTEFKEDFVTVREITPSFRASIAEKKKINSDAVGWLYIPDTTVDEVVLQTPAEQSNDYYLNLNLHKQPDKDGSLCSDRRINFGSGRRDELSRNIAVFGHSWDDDPDGEIFSQLKKYRDPQFARTHPYIYFSTGSEDMVWEVFAVFDTQKNVPYILPNQSNNTFFSLLDIIYDASLYSYDSAVNQDDKILTLSTCTYSVAGHENMSPIQENDYRFVIMAKLVDPAAEYKDEAVFAHNPDPISPDEMQKRWNDRRTATTTTPVSVPKPEPSIFPWI